jgi:predicted MFS family arabinose efflux permease
MLGLLVASYFLRFINSDLHKWLLVEWEGQFQRSIADLGLITVAITLPWGVAAPLLGPFSDRYGRKPLLVVGLALAGLSSALTALSWDLHSLIFFRFLAGVGGAASAPAAITVIGDVVPPQQRGKPMAFLFAGEAIGALVGIPIITWAAGSFGWRTAFIVEGALYLPIVLAMLFVVPFPRWHAQATSWTGGLSAVLRDRWTVMLLILNALVQVSFFVADTYLPSFIRKTYNLDLHQTVPVTYILAVGTLLGALSGGPLADRLPRYTGAAGTAIATGILGMAMVYLTGNLWLSVALAAGFRAVHYAYRPIYTCIITQVQTARRGTVMGLNATSNNLGTAAGSALGNVVLTGFGFPPLGIAALMLSLVPAIGIPLLGRLRPPDDSCSTGEL